MGRIWGYAPEEIEPCRDAWKTLVHPDDLLRVEQQVAAHLAGKTEIYRVEQRLRHKQGNWVWILSIGKVVARDASGNPLRATGVHMDITHQQHLQDQGVDLLRQIEALIQRAGHPVSAITEPAVPLLTERQRQILELVAAGLTSEEIGKQLNISTATAVTHRRNIMQAVGARSTAELIKRAVKYGWI